MILKSREAEYVIEEDDKYCLGIVNTNPRSIIMAMNVNVSSKMYDTTKAKSMCSTINGSCRLSLLFPYSQFVTVTTPNNGDLGEWYVELSFVARVVTYIAILGFVVIIIFLIHKYLRACDGDTSEVTETDPLVPEKPFRMPYGTGEAYVESGSSSSSDDLNDGKICVICYEEPRNCFFVPCGHCATCYTCAQRIMDGATKVCPICRRLIHKVRKLLIP
ncbi:E3 ubiquitin-protein ligase APD1-like [Actinidia eriantha]|uniref:E3 ubiquitin-protein ligase APD1-like n=1 Tax=Actinidia eriantha TaxID=165200 RepID=UPI0025873E85|nr:E3 ubiquitin-protein ligase APD1-like [Actinidia eriantha]